MKYLQALFFIIFFSSISLAQSAETTVLGPTTFMRIFGILWILILLSSLVSFFCLYQILKEPHLSGSDKLPWILVVIMVPVIGVILHFMLFKKTVRRKLENSGGVVKANN